MDFDSPFNLYNYDDLAEITYMINDCQYAIDLSIAELWYDDSNEADILDGIAELTDKMDLLIMIRGIMEQDIGIN